MTLDSVALRSITAVDKPTFVIILEERKEPRKGGAVGSGFVRMAVSLRQLRANLKMGKARSTAS